MVTTVGTLAVCSIANTTLQITGQNFLQLAGPPILNPTIVISGMDLTEEQKKQLTDFGQGVLTKGAFSEKELLTSIQRSLERIQAGK